MATASETVGPFFHIGLTADAALGCLADPTTKGERVRLRVAVTDADGRAVPDALIEIGQVDADGHAAAAPGPGERSGFGGFGRLPTGEDGTCEFQTVRPGRVTDGSGGMQAAHINVCLFARGLLRHLHTRIYFAGDPDLSEDAVLALVAAERRHTLLAIPDEHDPGRWQFAIRLQGDGETVFFDL